MKRLVLFLMALSAFGLFTFYEGAVSSPDGADVVMGRVSIWFGILSIICLVLVRKKVMLAAAALLSAIFWLGVHPNPLPVSFVLVAILAAAIVVASLLEHSYGKSAPMYGRILATTAFALSGAIIAQHAVYRNGPEDSPWGAVAFAGGCYFVAFLIAPWRSEDFAQLTPRALWNRLGRNG